MLASICYAALGMVLHLFVSLLHLIWPTWGFLLGLIRRLVAGADWGLVSLGHCGDGTALSFWRQVSDAIPRKHWGFGSVTEVSASRSTVSSQGVAMLIGSVRCGLI
jgi:hypothetical protein